MATYINGKLVETSADKKAAVEAAGGTYNENIKGIFVQNRKSESNTNSSNSSNKATKNYVENLDGDYIVDGEVQPKDKKRKWF